MEESDLTTHDAARLLGVHPATLKRWADEGDVPYWETPGRRRRFRRVDLDALREPKPQVTEEKAG